MSTRDELAAVLWHRRLPYGGLAGLHISLDANAAHAAAELVLAAGYSKPRTVETVEELDALPEGTCIVDQAERLTLEETSIQCLEWVDRHGNACHVELPATVLYEPAP